MEISKRKLCLTAFWKEKTACQVRVVWYWYVMTILLDYCAGYPNATSQQWKQIRKLTSAQQDKLFQDGFARVCFMIDPCSDEEAFTKRRKENN